ncbi:MAG: hypothetical protein WCZ90_05015 [Melioribacteraceae bacterium]
MSLEVVNSLSKITNTQLGAKRVSVPEDTKRDFSERLFSPTKQDEAKSLLVSEKLDDGKFLQLTDVRYHINTPVAKLLTTAKVFNETELVKKTSDAKTVSRNIDDVDEYDEKEKDEESGSGFYIVTNQNVVSSSKLLPKSKTDLLRENLTNAYNSTVRKENGRLVNLTF